MISHITGSQKSCTTNNITGPNLISQESILLTSGAILTTKDLPFSFKPEYLQNISAPRHSWQDRVAGQVQVGVPNTDINSGSFLDTNTGTFLSGTDKGTIRIRSRRIMCLSIVPS
jgi:hypothetical protein